MEDLGKSKKSGGVFLVVVDETHEHVMAVDYACKFANASNGYVALLHISTDVVVQNWFNVEERLRKEMRDEAEKLIWEASGTVLKETGKTPMVFLEEGDTADIVHQIIKDNENISALVLASANASKPGPLVTYFSGKGLVQLDVPLLIIPGHLSVE